MALSDKLRRLLNSNLCNSLYGKELADAIDANTPGGSTVTASVAEINDALDGNTATAAEITRAADVSGRVVAVGVSATVYAITATVNGGRVLLVNSTVPCAITLPAATGTFEKYEIRLSVAATATGHTIKVANTADAMAGVSIIAQTDTAQVNGFLTTATDDTITLNGTTKGGLPGDKIEIIDIASAKFQVTVVGGASGTVVTPFSASV